jgi:dolichol-phosphate mannosyltransferase
METGVKPVLVFPSPHVCGQTDLDVSIIIPTLNERENLPVLIGKLQEAMEGRRYELVIVDDDSEDGTWQVAEEFSQRYRNIRVIRRINRKGLSSAIVEGFLLGQGKYVAVLDADLQHDHRLIGAMIDEIGDCDLVIGSRYMNQKSVPGWGSWRSRLSRAGTVMSQKLLKQEISDPMSGFFMIRRKIIQEIAPQLFEQGYKILFDILIRRPDLKVKELPYDFKARLYGTSKLTAAVIFDFADLVISRAIPSRFNLRFIRYGAVGASGVVIHLFTLYLLYVVMGLVYPVSLVLAIETAMVSNYALNNHWTFKEHRFLGLQWWKGLVKFNLACLVGSALNLAVGWYLVEKTVPWFYASVLGIWVGTSWNYLSNSFFTWGRNP